MGEDCDKATAARIKGEICSRIAELQKIRELQAKAI